MRLWSLHPSYLDRQGLLALWREGLLAASVLAGKTSGYRHHPQLYRFRSHACPHQAINSYLGAVHAEATARGYRFDGTKLDLTDTGAETIPVALGQLQFERDHLRYKLANRDPGRLWALTVWPARLHPLFYAVVGDIEPWEKAIRSESSEGGEV